MLRRAAALLLALAPPAAPALAAVSYRTVTGKGLCSFSARKDWKVEEHWKGDEPGALLKKGESSIAVSFQKEGAGQYPTLEAYRRQAARPNADLEKVVVSSAAVVDGREAEVLHIEMLDMLWATMHAGPKKRVLRNVVLGSYPGGYFVLAFAAPEAAYAAERPEFERFLSRFKLLVPKAPAAPAVSSPSAPALPGQ